MRGTATNTWRQRQTDRQTDTHTHTHTHIHTIHTHRSKHTDTHTHTNTHTGTDEDNKRLLNSTTLRLTPTICLCTPGGTFPHPTDPACWCESSRSPRTKRFCSRSGAAGKGAPPPPLPLFYCVVCPQHTLCCERKEPFKWRHCGNSALIPPHRVPLSAVSVSLHPVVHKRRIQGYSALQRQKI